MLLCNTCTCVNMNRDWTEHGHWLPSIKKWHIMAPYHPWTTPGSKANLISSAWWFQPVPNIVRIGQDHPPFLPIGTISLKHREPESTASCDAVQRTMTLRITSPSKVRLAELYWIVLTSLATADFNRKINRLGRLGTNKKENYWRLGANPWSRPASTSQYSLHIEYFPRSSWMAEAAHPCTIIFHSWRRGKNQTEYANSCVRFTKSAALITTTSESSERVIHSNSDVASMILTHISYKNPPESILTVLDAVGAALKSVRVAEAWFWCVMMGTAFWDFAGATTGLALSRLTRVVGFPMTGVTLNDRNWQINANN